MPLRYILFYVDPSYIRSIDGKSSIFSDETLHFLKKVAKIDQKSGFAKKSA